MKAPNSNRVANVVAVAGVIALLAVGTVFVGHNIDLARQNETLSAQLAVERERTNAATENAQSLYEQLLDEGINPDAEQPDDVVDAVPDVVTKSGSDGADGRDGVDGRTPSRTELAALINDYCAANNDCRGEPGLAGINGSNGVNGTNGADGLSVVGPQGIPGLNGADGVNGAAGADGQPPSSWTFTDFFGNTQTCTRTDPFDPAAPTYQCA